jgi:autotransporter-associated beta strand protein
MKPHNLLNPLAVSLLLAVGSNLHAASYTWDASGDAPLNDGGGSWNATGGTNWFNNTGLTYGAWGNTTADEAVFGVGSGAAGTINVGSVNANKLTFNAPGSGNYLLSGGTITLGGTTPTVTANSSATIGSVLAGSVAWTAAGAGTLTLNGANTYSGNLTNSGCTVAVGTSAFLCGVTSPFVIINNGGVVQFSAANPLGYHTSGGLGGAGAGGDGEGPAGVVLNNGTIEYTGTSSSTASAYGVNQDAHSFTTTGNPGTIKVDNSGVTFTFGTFRPANNSSAYDQVIDNAGIIVTGAGNVDMRKYITGTGGLTMNGTGTCLLGPALTGTGDDNTYAGDTTVNSGTLKLRSDYAAAASRIIIPSGSGKGNVVLNSPGVLDLNTRSISINGLSGNGTVSSSAAGALTLTCGNNAATTTFSGAIQDGSGTVALTKTGTGTLTLGGVNTYSGATTVSNGLLKVTGSLAAGSAVSVDGTSGSAYATLGGSGTVNGPLVVNQFAHLAPSLASGTAASTLNGSGSVTLADGSALDVVFALNGTANDVVSGNGANTLTLPGSGTITVNLYNSAGGLGNGTYTLFGNFASISGTVSNVFVIGLSPLVGKSYTFAQSGAGAVTLTIASQTAYTWNGAGANNNWLTGANWTGGAAPGTNNFLTFAGATRTSPNNDFPAGSAFTGIGFSANAAAFTLGGNDIALTGDILNSSANNQTISLNLALAGTRTAIVGTNRLTLGGALSGSGSLAVNGTGVLALNGNNTGYTGSVSIPTGSLRAGTSNALPATALTLAAPGTLDLNNQTVSIGNLNGTGTITTTAPGNSSTLDILDSTSTTFGGVIQNGGANLVSLQHDGAGTLTLTGTNTFTGPATINNGILQIAGGNNLLSPSGSVVANAPGAFDLNNQSQTLAGLSGSGSVTLGSGTLTAQAGDFTGVISGSGTLTKTGNGTLTLEGNNTYTGNANISAGTLAVTSSGMLFNANGYSGTSVATVSGGATLSLAGWNYNEPGSFGLLDSGYPRVVVDNGTLRYTGFGNAAGTPARRAFSVGSGGATLAAEGAGPWTIGTGGNATYNQIVLGTNGGVLTLTGSQNGDFQSYVTGTGSVVKSGAGTWTFGSSSGATENNTYTGDTAVNSGTLQLRNGFAAAAIPFGAGKGNVTVVSNGVLDINGVSATVNGLTGNGTIRSSIYGGVLAVGANNQTSTFAGLIEDGPGFNLSLTKVGNGILTLTGAETYTGATTVNAGMLNGTGSLMSPVTVNSGGTLGAGTTTALGTLTMNSTLSFNAGSTNYLRISKTGGVHTNDLLVTAGQLVQAGTLVVSNVTSDLTTVANGETFSLFNAAGGVSGGFAAVSLPNLPAGWIWNTNALATTGQITATNAAITSPVVFSPPAGGYLGALAVTLSCATPEATIYYTTNGSAPTNTSLVYGGPITIPVNATVTVKAYAHTNGFSDSAVQTAVYQTQSGAVWTNLAGGSWPLADNWQNGIVGQGSSVTADFSTLALAGDTVVTLDSSPTIGHVLFGDAGSNYNWTVQSGNPAGTLTLQATNAPTVAVNNQTVTLALQVAGTNGLTKTGNGTLTLATNNPYTGGTIVNGGTLNLSYNNGGSGTIGGALTVNPGATAVVTVNNALGYTGGNWVTNITLNGGTLNTSVSTDNGWGTIIDMTGGTLGSTVSGGYFAIGQGNVAGSGIFNVHATNVPSVISADLTMRQNSPLAMQFNVARGTAAADLEVTGNIRVAANGGLIKSGAGIMQMDGASTYTGATVVSNGTLLVNGSLASASVVTVLTNGTLAGLGNVAGTVTNYGTVAPGGSAVGSFSTGGETWYPGSVVVCKLAGTSDDSASRDHLTINGTLDLSQLSSTATASLRLVSMLNSNTPGNMPGFDPAGSYTWTIGGATGLNPLDPSALSLITLNTSAFSNPHPGTFSLTVDIGTGSLLLQYTGSATVSTNADLAALAVTPLGTLSPAFASNVLSYTTTEAYANSQITVTPTAADPAATIQVIYGGATNTVASGGASSPLALDANPLVVNGVTVRVTAQDTTTTKDYVVNVTRLPSTTPPTLSRSYSGGSLTLSWPLDHSGYTLQSQTNSRSVGLTNAWYPVAGSTATNTMTFTVRPADPTVFFRLFHP